MFENLKKIVRVATNRTLLGSVGLLSLVTLSGCVVYDAPPPRRVYYYGPGGVVYTRPYYGPSSTVVVTTPPPAAAPAPAPAVTVETPASQALQPLVAPIALYPDPLIAEILPASTYPNELQAAAAWLAANPNPPTEAIEAQPWPPAVKAVVHYPNVLTQLTGDMQWTQSLGSAFTNQPADVSAAIQQMRAQASAQGNLVTTPQETVIQDGGVISIQPTNTEVVYVPTYDPVLVYVGYHPLIWGVGYPCGPWFSYGCDWYGGGFIFVGDWHGGYYYHGGVWGRDYAWRGGGYHRFEHDSHFGPAPHVDHFAMARGVGGREADLHHAMEARATERHNIQHVASRAAAAHPEMSRTPSRTATPEHNTAKPSAEHGAARPGAEHSEHAEGRTGERR